MIGGGAIAFSRHFIAIPTRRQSSAEGHECAQSAGQKIDAKSDFLP
jgi:hypothetical protein